MGNTTNGMVRNFLIAMLFLVMLLAGCRGQSTHLFLGDEYFFLERQGMVDRYQTSGGDPLVVERGEDRIRVEVSGKVYLVSGTYNQADYTFPDGRVLSRRITGQSVEGLVPFDVDLSIHDWEIVDDLQAIAFGPSAGDSSATAAANVVFGILAAAFGMLQIAKPRAAFFLTKGWKYRNLEPSDAFLLATRASGLVFILVGILLATGVFQ
jgi:hypothetical protein